MKKLITTAVVAALMASTAPQAHAFTNIKLTKASFFVALDVMTRTISRTVKGPKKEGSLATRKGTLDKDGLTVSQGRTLAARIRSADRGLKAGTISPSKHEELMARAGRDMRRMRTQNRIAAGSGTGINGEYSDPHKEGGSPHFSTRGD